MSAARKGSVLVVIVGILAMLATLAVTFLVRMRQDAQESDLVIHLTQCRMMLHAGMQFIQERSRLGYATAGDPSLEAWGWIDIRDGSLGPKDDSGALRQDEPWMALGGPAKRCPMYMVKRPPCAVVPHMYPNAIPAVSDPAVDPAYQDHFGIPVLANVDPMPVLPAGLTHIPDNPDPAQRAAWEAGDLQPVQMSMGLAWFRVYRETGTEPDRPATAGPPGATFILTVGSGATVGFKDWSEVPVSDRAQFGNDQAVFDSLRAAEVREWYRVEWSAAVGGSELRNAMGLRENKDGGQDFGGQHTTQARSAVNPSRRFKMSENLYGSTDARNYVGTISYIERLSGPPSRY
ncbi:MAG: hypothetical protein H0W72_01180 [Planctomycetes bacterium]|nr:hypothetical protein [Planctomycetota bacterium]